MLGVKRLQSAAGLYGSEKDKEEQQIGYEGHSEPTQSQPFIFSVQFSHQDVDRREGKGRGRGVYKQYDKVLW